MSSPTAQGHKRTPRSHRQSQGGLHLQPRRVVDPGLAPRVVGQRLIPELLLRSAGLGGPDPHPLTGKLGHGSFGLALQRAAGILPDLLESCEYFFPGETARSPCTSHFQSEPDHLPSRPP